MATPTYDPIASTTLTLPALSVTFSSLDTIAAGYRDLVLLAYAESTPTAAILNITINGDTNTANYAFVNMQGDGSSYGSGTGTNRAGSLATGPNALILNFFDFSVTDKHKSILTATDAASNVVYRSALRWASTSAITSITLTPVGDSFAAGSVLSLYGIVA